MREQHVNEDLLDQYVVGSMDAEPLPELEEHLLVCGTCQSRLKAADEFAHLFREASSLPEARATRPWWQGFRRPAAGWTAAAVAAAALILFVAPRSEPAGAPVAAYLQSFRGPEG